MTISGQELTSTLRFDNPALLSSAGASDDVKLIN